MSMNETIQPLERDRAEPSDTSRWLAAVSYAFVVAVFVVVEARRKPLDEFVRFHARQGFVLFFVEFALLIVTMILNATVGQIEVAGAVLMITWKLCVGLAAVGVSVMGFMYGLSGEIWHLPILGRFANRVPI
jgi:uncharacterized membrane protein